MAELRAGVIGCGGRGRIHAQAFGAAGGVAVVAGADASGEARQAFAADFGAPRVYADYEEMLERESLDIVSVCTWPRLHREMIVAAAGSGIRAIHAEKPIAPTWGECREIYRACADHEVVTTFSHQRRFEAPFVTAKALVDEGAIGELYRVEGACPNLFDWGTHWFDMCFFYNNEEPAEWVMGQIDVSTPREIFGVPVTASGLSWIRWQNGLEGLVTTGDAARRGPRNRLIGTEGIIEAEAADDPPVRLLRAGQDWTFPDLAEVATDSNTAVVVDLIECLRTGREPVLSARKAMQASELIFATYESSRRRARIDLPLETEDSALLAMLEEGAI